MVELELTLMGQGPDPAGDLRALLERFEAEERTRVHVTVYSWETGWTEIVKVALYGHGPDLSDVGTTWIGNLGAMNALRPLAAADVSACGGQGAFLPAAWQSGVLRDAPEVWAIPWLADTRVIYYRRDLLEAAGIDPVTAFRTHGDLERTLETLLSHGHAMPWAVPSTATLNTVHIVASWVWGAGGDFVTGDGRQFILTRDAAMAGLRAYFGLARFLTPAARGLGATQASDLFLSGHAAMCISGPWTWAIGMNRQQAMAPEIARHVGAAVPPGIPFVGGSSLVLWRHSPHDRDALRLIRLLTNPVVQAGYSQRVGLLPTRLDVLDTPLFTTDPLGSVMSQALRSGRAFPTLRLWGLVEEKVSAVLARVWSDVLAAPEANLDTLIHKHLDPLTMQLNRTLANH